MKPMSSKDLDRALRTGLRVLRMPGIREWYREIAEVARKESLSFERFLLMLVEQEQQNRTSNRNKRTLRASQLPLAKTLDRFDRTRLPIQINHQLSSLLEGRFLDSKENVIALGPPGSGKTHLVCALGNELIHRGRRIRFYRSSELIEELVQAKQKQCLLATIRQLMRHEGLILDGLGDVQHSQAEAEVLFRLLAECYERRSIVITSHRAFSQWEPIFQTSTMTTAALDRLVHHSVILELDLPSYRLEVAQRSRQDGALVGQIGKEYGGNHGSMAKGK